MTASEKIGAGASMLFVVSRGVNERGRCLSSIRCNASRADCIMDGVTCGL